MNVLDPNTPDPGLKDWLDEIRPHGNEALAHLLISDPERAAGLLAQKGVAPPTMTSNEAYNPDKNFPLPYVPGQALAFQDQQPSASESAPRPVPTESIRPPTSGTAPVAPAAPGPVLRPGSILDRVFGGGAPAAAQSVATAPIPTPPPRPAPQAASPAPEAAPGSALDPEPQAAAVPPPAAKKDSSEPDIAKVLAGLKALVPPTAAPVSTPAVAHPDPRGLGAIDPIKMMQLLHAMSAASPRTGLGTQLHAGR